MIARMLRPLSQQATVPVYIIIYNYIYLGGGGGGGGGRRSPLPCIVTILNPELGGPASRELFVMGLFVTISYKIYTDGRW